MITHHLWQRIANPPAKHPVFARIIARNTYGMGTQAWIWLPLAILLPVLLMPGLILIDVAYGMLWSVNISRWLLRYRRTMFYDLIRLTTDDDASINWVISLGVIHHKGAFTRSNSVSLWLARGMFLLVLLVSFVLSLPFFVLNSDRTGEQVMVIFAVMLTLFIHHRQSVIMSVLIGMLSVSWVNDDFLTPMITGGVYLTMQLVSLTTGLVLTFIIMPAFINITFGVVFEQFTLWLLLSVTFFVGLREVMIWALTSTFRLHHQISLSNAIQSLDRV